MHIAHAPTRYHLTIGDGRRLNIHHHGMMRHHRLDDGVQTHDGLSALLLGGQRQLSVEVGPLLLTFGSLGTRSSNPVAMTRNKLFNCTLWQSDGCSDVHIAILHDAHRQSSGPLISHAYCHANRVIFLLQRYEESSEKRAKRGKNNTNTIFMVCK